MDGVWMRELGLEIDGWSDDAVERHADVRTVEY